MGYFLFGAFMNSPRVLLAFLAAAISGSAILGQAPAQTPTPAPAPAATSQDKSPAMPDQHASASSPEVAKTPSRADAYYNFTMGHIYEQQYETTSKPEFATQAIDAYKKAYALDPKSPVIGERLAEMYWKAQRTHEAVTEAQALLKRDPNDIQSRRLLGRIYLRSPGRFQRWQRPVRSCRTRHRAIRRNLSPRSRPMPNRRCGWRASIASATNTTKPNPSSAACSRKIPTTSRPSSSSPSFSLTKAKLPKPSPSSKK